MPPAVTGAFQRMRRVVAGFSLAQRTIAIIGIAVLALGIIALSSWLSRPTYTPLFSGLNASDANAVVEQLRSASVPYELADGGATVLVPEKDVYDQRLAAASAGLPSAGSAGYSLLDDMGVTTSEFQQSVTYKRAIEGELAATISAIDGVSAASVQLAIPEESVFVSETVDATASVFVETAGRTTLDQKQVEAIVHLTSAAVSGMKPENVAVVDQTGRTLSTVGGGATGGLDQQASDYEARVAASVQQMLDTVVGPGNATVTVVAEIDRSVNERVEETYTPAEGAPPLTEEVREQNSNGSTSEAGVLGPDNIAVPNGNGDGTYTNTEETRTNAVNKATESTSTPAGTLLRQSVSVAVDAGAGGDLSSAQLSDLVATAAGIDRTRGDELAVELVAFSQTDAEAAQAALQAAKEAEEGARQAALLNTVIIAAAIAIPLIAAIAALIVRSRRKARGVEEFDQLFGDRPVELSALSADAPTAVLEAPTTPLAFLEPVPDLDPDPEPEPTQISLERRRAEIAALTRQDPQRTAELLRTLIDDRSRV
ncbi:MULTISPECIES: flagellar basal-body MS-ring/collar protein FliF [Microbacterium]|uniref:flagellar basal-body MS-ring/collar protein FliF n=1 Tax=Microbacterium TaxID=33882 RepID=UPI0021A6E3A2|nr:MULTISPECIES: flagellar basal-body MS-ring/collar protein FliF [Microbacterium]MCT1366263.1 flagellar M-ring protein FliF [Microbacterium sp. p3-SID131]MCT1377916.1 flagellar M-ring protein FliF [Microbacterium sp. p3-SID337]MDH5134849.1 flagellar basal-body MS-ring/collar protein FliF [Microbacterium sp. RD10]MDH5138473.1 flagellar basal-body MS-ring/collar protein FliF [Microbacterium sp. RD11]MDH5145394.1 flagellar basal-body MS-ring/collar protein FliF [Microbacterium sp. RD12]